MQITGKLENSKTKPAPKIECYMPENGNGKAIVILPDGGYGGLAEHEGAGYAEYFVKEGYACFVVEYRLGSKGFRHPAMLEDALAAIYAVRSRAEEFKINSDKIGIMGSSAGGHLAAHTSNAYDQYESSISLRPDFTILCYPVINLPHDSGHEGSYKNLLGEDATLEHQKAVAPALLVTENTPECFLWHTAEDLGVPVKNSLDYAIALNQNNILFDLHIYETGGHGLGLNTEHPWAQNCIKWLERR
ncbi:MAG: alpha/beta hydrolase [Kiritimatiellae bacterium]|nr:alpha/beta hydrolase [Kiritimatiellia bacterium]